MTSSSKTKCILPNNLLPHLHRTHNLAPQIFTFSLELTSIPSMTNEVLRIFKKFYYVKYALSMISEVHIYVL